MKRWTRRKRWEQPEVPPGEPDEPDTDSAAWKAAAGTIAGAAVGHPEHPGVSARRKWVQGHAGFESEPMKYPELGR